MEKIDLKCDGDKYLWQTLVHPWTRRRLRKTREFLKKNLSELNLVPPNAFSKKVGKILCTGAKNDFDEDACVCVGAEYHYTNIDLDEPFPFIEQDFDYVFCFDVIEHLMNPLLFLRELRKMDTPVIISYPRHPFAPFWGSCHFHEFGEKQFYTLLSTAGFKVKHRTTFSTRIWWWKYLLNFGIRPKLRFILLMLGYPRHEIYYVEPN